MAEEIKRIVFKGIYYSVTLAVIVLCVFALRYAHTMLELSWYYWLLLYLLIAVYLAFAVLFTKKLRRGFHIFLAHTLLLQIVPTIAAILTFTITPNLSNRASTFFEDEEVFGPYKPIAGKVSTYERKFNDMQEKQKRAAIANGLAPFKSRADIEQQYKKLRREKKLVKIESNSKYVVRPLTYSSPYVVPKVERLLEDIADSFQKKTQSRARFMVTSVLRTEEDVKKLRRTNGNASTASCHCNATTIDISYVRFDQDESRPRDEYQLRLALAQTLHELRKEGRCYVRRERKQYCYHITVR
ncbi:MAG: hypothetical protein IKL60_04670 [Alistipes sp.]|nr:hypothetical protein [Alistipes sp.]